VPGTGEVARFPAETLGTHKDGNTEHYVTSTGVVVVVVECCGDSFGMPGGLRAVTDSVTRAMPSISFPALELSLFRAGASQPADLHPVFYTLCLGGQ
jgi:hypothetical protein